MSTHGTSTAHTPNWRTSAACSSVKPDTMFPAPGDKQGIDYAQSICALCPVRLDCLDFALADEGGKVKTHRFGIAGGLTPNQRYNEYNRRRKAALGNIPATPRTPPVAAETPRRNAAECGTPAGYKRHRRNGEEACPACLRAKADAIARYRQTGTTKAAA